MDDTPQDPRPPDPGSGEEATDESPTPTPPPAFPDHPPYPPSGEPPLGPPGGLPPLDDGDLPPLDDGDGVVPTKRRLLSGRRLLAAGVVALVLVVGGTAFALGGGSKDDDDSGIASLDGSDGSENADDSTGDGSRGGRVDESEFQDAMLEYAACMREHGVDMPDPEFTDGGGVFSRGPAGAEPGAPDQEEFEAADEACQPILEEVMPDIELSPEEQAEMQDQQTAIAQCMRDKGWDMPDPQVNDDGSVEIHGGPGAGGSGDAMTPENAEENRQDMEACREELGFDDGPMGPGGGGSDSSDDEGSA